jgi:hypothetical protein
MDISFLRNGYSEAVDLPHLSSFSDRQLPHTNDLRQWGKSVVIRTGLVLVLVLVLTPHAVPL